MCMPRDPADKELDPVKMRETKIPSFDAFFESAAAPLNELVEIHNSIAHREESVKAAAAALHGGTQIRLTVERAGQVALVFWCYDDKNQVHVLTAAEREEKLDFSVELREAFEVSDHAISTLNTAMQKPPTDAPLCQFAEKRGRLIVTKREQLDVLVRDVNVAVFTLRKHLMIQAQVTNLCEAVYDLLEELAKVDNLSALSATTSENGAIKIMNGEDPVDLRAIDNLTAPAAQLRDAMVELLESMETAAASVPELAESCAAFSEEAKEFPAKIPDAVTNAGLGNGEIPKVATVTARNVKAICNGSKIARVTTVMIKYACREVMLATSIPMGA
ncbi:hypothetical protein BBJ28_00018415 [Nothophytophthora sp. Chile5]|nr:hypothetical protein BBJ28_00018415 [Nothophytophthora sp. Chile5]